MATEIDPTRRLILLTVKENVSLTALDAETGDPVAQTDLPTPAATQPLTP